MDRPSLTEAALRSQIRRARALDVLDRKTGKRALSAMYDAASRRIILELTNGYLFGFPVGAIPALARASDIELAGVEASTGGMALIWEQLDVDLSVPGLLMSAIGRTWKLQELARFAGRSTSPAKAAAARANGRKGGRPRAARK